MSESRKRFKAAMRSYKAMGEYLKRRIGARSKSTILGINKTDDCEALSYESKLYVKRSKMRGNKPMSGHPKVMRVHQ